MSFEHQGENSNQARQDAAPKTFTQEQMDAMIGERLTRERAKYADYEDLKTKAAKYDEQEEAAKSDLQRAQDNAASLQKELDDMKAKNAARDARDKVAAAKGVPAELLTGITEEECAAYADLLLDWRSKIPIYAETHDGGGAGLVGLRDAGTSTRDQFAAFASDKLAFNPAEDENGWTRII